ncbi:MAG: glycogen synthase GlgA [Verrucomicrobiota bacterium]
MELRNAQAYGFAMKIVHAASEVYPYIKTGGLADAVGALTSTLAGRGHEVAVFLPGYRKVVDLPEWTNVEPSLKLRIEMGDQFMSGDVRKLVVQDNLTIYLVCRDEYFDRRNPYGNGNRDYEDNDNRFIFFAKGVVEAMRAFNLQADIVHCHDWQTGLLPLMLRHAESRHGETLADKTLFTIHNIAFQGVFPMKSFHRTNLPEELMGIDGVEFYGQMSMMKAGILFADRVGTVSPRYAEEIQTHDFGCGLDGVVATRADDLVGLINGIDTTVWNPATDALIPANYSAADLSGKKICRAELLTRHGFDPAYAGPVFGMVCRITEQKGIDLVLANAAWFAANDCRLIVLGTGDAALTEALRKLAFSHPGKVAVSARHDEAMSHLVEAGADFFVMPSKFEPCGLNQLYSQAYGTVPLVSQVGGLVDTVIDIDAEPATGTGITFPPTATALALGLKRALALFAQPDELAAVRRRGMTRDFSWETASQAYEDLYEDTL